jgi:hypothetical protein
MRLHWLRTAVCLTALALAGCGRTVVDATDGVTPEDTDTRLGDKISIDLEAWLQEPRADLAKRAEEYVKTIEHQQEGIRNHTAEDLLLPRLQPPTTVPVFNRATFSAQAGFSLPDYLPPGRRDAVVALHLARFGDHEAALKLADPGNAGLRRAIAGLMTGKNYPLEWSRLVGLALVSAQYKVALGDVDGATELVLLHQQLVRILDSQAAAGALGSALLPAGRRALSQGSKGWRNVRWNKTLLAEDIDKALAEWGNPPLSRPGLVLGATKEEAVALLGVPARSKAVIAATPAEVARALDLLALPVPPEGAHSVAAFLSEDGRVASFIIAYRGKLDTTYPEPGHLAYHLDERGWTATEETPAHGLVRLAVRAGNLNYDINRFIRSPGLGALVHIRAGKAGPLPAHEREPRTLGPVHLDRGYETTRVALTPDRAGHSIVLDDRDTLQALVQAIGLPTPAAAVVQRDTEHDLIRSVRLSWLPDQGAQAASLLLPAVFAHLGPAGAEGIEASPAGQLRLRWQDERTRVDLQLPYDEKPPVLLFEDVQPSAKMQERLTLVRARDETERQQRLAQGKEQRRLPRSPGVVNDFSLEKLSLGQGRADAEAALPRGKRYRVKEVQGGLSLLDLHAPTPGHRCWATQVLLRFDEQAKVSEIRIRYREGLAQAKNGPDLLHRLTDAKAGAPEKLASSWVGLWTDLPVRDPKPVLYRWHDDLTIRTYERDAGGSEIVLRDRNAKDEERAWRFLAQGPSGCSLGDSRERVEGNWGAPATTSAGASVYRQATNSPYEMALVWYTADRVSRIVAVHREKTGTQPREVAATLQRLWGRDIDALGTLRGQEGRRTTILGSYFWHDDRTRVQNFVRVEDDIGRVLTEWREWPLR